MSDITSIIADLKIKAIPTTKTKIKQRPHAEAGVIPRHPKVSLFNGSQGSGKTTLLVNLIKDKRFYGGPKNYFDKIILFTNSDDDMYDDLIEKGIIDENHIKFNPDEADVQKLIDFQNAIIKSKGNVAKAPKILVIFEDIVSNRKLMGSKPFLECFVRPRHLNFSVWLLTQYLPIVPKPLRMQADHLFSFRGNRAEVEILEDEYTTPGCCRRCFRKLVHNATRAEEGDEFPFIHIKTGEHPEQRFRRNLDTIGKVKCTKG